MKLPRKRLLYFVLLGVPTLFIGGVALFLLRQEHQRLESRLTTDTQIKAEALAERLATGIGTIQASTMNHLRFVAEPPFMAGLLELRASDPHIRNVFEWESINQVQVGRVPGRFSQEENQFKERFHRLFYLPGGPLEKSLAEGREAGFTGQQSQVSNSLEPPPTERWYQWKVWYWEDGFSWVGWSARVEGYEARIIGVELETMFVLGNLLSNLQLPKRETTVYRILDHRDVMFHQTGTFPEGPGSMVEVPIGPALPGWRIQAKIPEIASVGAVNFFAWPARMILLLLVMAVLLAGLALLRQADRDYRDALQKTNFVANVSHELKTPLTSISMYAEMLQADRVHDEAKRQKYLDVIVRQTERLTRLVNNVLTLAPLEEGKGRFELKQLALDELVNEVLATQNPRLKEKGIRLDSVTTPVTIIADPDALTQVFLNLLDNAVKYGCESTHEPCIEVRVGKKAGFAELRVMDRGPGIPAKWVEKVFDKFFRGDDSLTRKKGGSGIGLAIARLLVRGMNGTLDYESQPNYGASFVVRIPVEGEVV